jgi:DNA-binding transcriptional LysR family regulator
MSAVMKPSKTSKWLASGIHSASAALPAACQAARKSVDWVWKALGLGRTAADHYRHASGADMADRADLWKAMSASPSNMSCLAGTIRVSTLDIFADLLAPDLALFRREHPEIQLEITTEPHFVELDLDRVDLAIRLARPLKGDDGLGKLAALSFGVYGAPAYHAAAASRGADAAHDLLALFPHVSAMDHEFLLADELWYQRENLRGCVVARADSYPMLRRLAEEGMGLAMLPRMLARESPRLERLAGSDEDFAVEVWAVIRRDAMKLRKTRLLVEWLAKAFRAYAPVLAGAEAARDAAAA